MLGLLGPNIAAVILDTALVSYLKEKSSLAARHNACMLFALPVALLAQAVAQSALPQLVALAAGGRYARLRRLLFKVVGAALLLGLPAAILLCIMGRALIHLFFHHGAFKRNSTNPLIGTPLACRAPSSSGC